jgi:hypothetical protein
VDNHLMDTRRLQLLLSGLKVCGEISLEMANGGEVATDRTIG